MSELNATHIHALSDLFVAISPNLALALSEQFNLAVELDTPVVEAIPLQDLLKRTERALYTYFSLTQPLPVAVTTARTLRAKASRSRAGTPAGAVAAVMAASVRP